MKTIVLKNENNEIVSSVTLEDTRELNFPCTRQELENFLYQDGKDYVTNEPIQDSNYEIINFQIDLINKDKSK